MKKWSCFRVVWKDPINVKLGSMTMYTAPPPGSGVLLAFIMNVLNGFLSDKEEKIVWQRIVETFKWAYARRTQLGDPEFELDVGKFQCTYGAKFVKCTRLKTFCL